MAFLSSEQIELSTNIITKLTTMDGPESETTMFEATSVNAEALDTDIFSTFNFLSASPSDPNMLHDVDVDPFTLRNDKGKKAYDSSKEQKENNHELLHEPGTNESYDTKQSASAIVLEDATTPNDPLKASEITSDINGLKLDSANPVLYCESIEQCED